MPSKRGTSRRRAKRTPKPSAKAAAMLGIDMNEATRPVKMRSSSRGNSKSATKRKKSSGKAEWKPKVPPILNCAPSGWKPNFVTSNFLLCPANFDYWVADAIVPPLYAIGVDTPNKITCLNCVLRAFIIWLLLTYQYLWVTILLPWTQVREGWNEATCKCTTLTSYIIDNLALVASPVVVSRLCGRSVRKEIRIG